MGMFGRKQALSESEAAKAHRQALTRDLTFEIVPLKSFEMATEALPAAASVSVTCSPNKGIGETQRIANELLARGFEAIPHISARMVRDRAHTKELAAWFRDQAIDRIFVVGGDADEPGRYHGAPEFLDDLLDTEHGLSTIGVTAYPDGHAFLSDEQVHKALHDKERMLTAAGIGGYCSTQMCFDPEAIAKWLRTERERGLALPVHLGISGVVDKAKLLTMGVRLGIGDSLKYLRKNKAAVAKMLTSPAYDPNDLLVPLSADLLDLGVDGLHVFTFNQVEATEAWRQANLEARELGR